MLISAPLATWLADPVLQDATHARTIAFSERWLAHPLFVDTIREIKGATEPSVDSMLTAARRFMERDGDLRRMMDELVAEAAADPFFRPPFTPLAAEISKGYVLYDCDRVTILANVINADAIAAKKDRNGGEGTIAFTGLVTLYRYLKAGGATLSFWEARRTDAQFSAEEAGGLRMTGRRRIQDGEIWVMDGRHESFVIEHASSDIVQIQALIKVDCAPMAVEYDAKTGAFAAAAATDEVSSRIQMMVTLLRLMGRDDASHLIEQLLDSPHFFTRWHLMRELLALDAEAALPHLRRMASGDPHSEVRSAAGRTLEMFFPHPAGKGEN